MAKQASRRQTTPKLYVVDPPVRESSYMKTLKPKGENQKRLLEEIDKKAMVFAIGPAGTGKSLLAVSKAIDYFQANKISKIILCRPAVEAGEHIGYLPGDMEEKLAPYLRPLYDILVERLSKRVVQTMMEKGEIEIAAAGYLRGRTLSNAFIILDEAQNCGYAQLKMILTRIGWNSTMVITGDLDQSDLPIGISGLKPMLDKLSQVENIGIITLNNGDIVRHPLVSEMLKFI